MEARKPPSKASGKQSSFVTYSVDYKSVSGEESPSEIIEQIASTSSSDKGNVLKEDDSDDTQSSSIDECAGVVSTSTADNSIWPHHHVNDPFLALPIGEYLTYSVDTLARVFNTFPVKPLPIVPKIETELVITGIFHSCLNDIAHNREQFDKQMDLITGITYQLNSLPYGGKESDTLHGSLYGIFNPPPTASFYDMLDCMFYIGQTRTNSRNVRYIRHILFASGEPNNIDVQCSQSVHEHILNCWNAGGSIHFDNLATFVTEREMCFLEYISIAFLSASPSCQNICRGSTTGAKLNLLPVKLSSNAVVTMGCAFVMSYYFANRDYFHTKPRFFNPKAAQGIHIQDKILPTIDSAVTMAISMPVPAFGLLETGLTNKDHTEYACHLLVSLFTIPPKYTRWFLLRSNACIDLHDCKDVDFRFDILEAINTVLSYSDFTFFDCIKWARSLHYHLFTTIVNAANKEQKQKKHALKYEAPKNNADYNKHKDLFISSAAVLLSVVVGIKDKEGKSLTTKHAMSLNNQMKPSEFTLLVPASVQYIRAEKFVDFEKFQKTLTPENTLVKDPRELKSVAITPIDPFWDIVEVQEFITSTRFLRRFCFTGSVCEKNRIYFIQSKGREFSFPYFRWAQRFIQFV